MSYKYWSEDETNLVRAQVKAIIDKRSNYYRSTKYLIRYLDRSFSSILSKLQNEFHIVKKDPMLYLITDPGCTHIEKK